MSEHRPFRIVSDYAPTGDQPAAIESLTQGVLAGQKHQVLLGATGTGKTFTMANLIEKVQRPTLVLCHNKTLAAQLYEEMRALFPDNAVSYFVSYYDYFQPEAYIPQRDIYIEKDSSRNDDLDRLRLAATSNLLSRRDTIVVASVSCIYGLGSPENYRNRVLTITRGDTVDRRELLLGLVDMQYGRSELDFQRGQFRARGDVIEVWPAYEQYAVRIELFGDEVDRIELVEPISGEVLATESQVFLFPAVHYVLDKDRLTDALDRIKAELDARVLALRSEGKLLEAQRLLSRTKYDLEMLEEVGFCQGVENYSAQLEGRPKGSRPHAMLDYFRFAPEGSANDWLLLIDESHVTIPQVRAMYNGDRARKQVLVDHGFRLPSAMDNRPLKFEEFEELVPQVVHVSATPGPWELEQADGVVVEQIIRPTGLLDPTVEVRPARGQVEDLVEECARIAGDGDRTIVTVLTKRLAEDLCRYLEGRDLRVRWLHSEVETLERLEILRALREGDFDVLVGVNLLREGLDLPEVVLVAIMDADKSGFLRSPTSMIQTIGRAARNDRGRCIMYADKMTPEMQQAIDETERRRTIQMAHNEAHGITPTTIRKEIRKGIEAELAPSREARKKATRGANAKRVDREAYLEALRSDMLDAAADMKFERAAVLRDRIQKVEAAEPDADGTIVQGDFEDDETSGKSRKGKGRRRSRG